MKYCKSCNTPVNGLDTCPVCGLDKPTKGVWFIVIVTLIFAFSFIVASPWISLLILVVGISFIFKRKADIKKHRIDIENQRKNQSDEFLNVEQHQKLSKTERNQKAFNQKSSKKEDKNLNFEVLEEVRSQKQTARNKYTEQDKSDFDVLWSGSESVEFSYKDSKGNRTRRDVILKTVKQNEFGEMYFSGFCMERMQMRSFRVDRITSKILWNGKRYDVETFTNSF